MAAWTALALFSGTARGFAFRPIERTAAPAAYWLCVMGFAAATLVLVAQALFHSNRAGRI